VYPELIRILGERFPAPAPFYPPQLVLMTGERLPATDLSPMSVAMFTVDEATAAAIRQAFEESGELAAVAELRRHFSGIVDNESAWLCVRTIAGWKSLPPLPRKAKWHTRSSTL
jgi:hypothetical protein